MEQSHEKYETGPLPYAVLCLASQSCLTLWDPMGCSSHAPLSMGIFQTRILDWVAMPSSRGSSQPRDWTQAFRIAGGFFTSWATREAHECWSGLLIPSPGDLPDPGIEPGLLHCRQILHQLSYEGSPPTTLYHTQKLTWNRLKTWK